MKQLHVSQAPHIHSGDTTQKIMLDVVIAMFPAAAVSVVLFGLKALWIIATCVITAVLAEYLFNLACGKKSTIHDLSAVVTGLLLALNLSTRVPLWQCALGSIFAIVIVKGVFGGIGKNIVNPAIAARVLMLLTFSSVIGGAAPSLQGESVLVSSATPLVGLNEGTQSATLSQLFLGTHGGTIGETCALALILGFIYLVVRKVIKWYVPVAYIATTFLCYIVFTGNFTLALSHVLAGGLLLGAIFMATDYVTTPVTNKGRVVFCIGCGILTFVIRQFTSYPEGVSISILVMNLLVPFIEKFTAKKTLGGIK